MAALVHLVQHAEVDNPDHLVCGSMPHFDLSPHGLEQARRVGRYLGARPVVAIWSSPQKRCLRTAEEIAARTGVPVRVDARLADWSLTDRWMGHPWSDLAQRFPGELEAYLKHPEQLGFIEEQLDDVASRIAGVVRSLETEHPHGDVVVVSHQDAIQAGILHLTGASVSQLHSRRPSDGAVMTLRPGKSWREETMWEPGEGPRFGERGRKEPAMAGRRPDGPTSA